MTTAAEAKDFAIVMGYEAMRICTHGTTEKAAPEDVIRWMRLMLQQQPKVYRHRTLRSDGTRIRRPTDGRTPEAK